MPTNFQKQFILLGAQLETLQDLLNQKQDSKKDVIKRELAQFSPAKRQYHSRELQENLNAFKNLFKKYKLDEHKNPWSVKEAQHLEVLREIVQSGATLRKDIIQIFHEAQEHNLKVTPEQMLSLIGQIDTLVFLAFTLLAQEAQENKSKEMQRFWTENAITINNLLQGYAIQAEQHLGGNKALQQAVKATEEVMKTTRKIHVL